MSEPAFWAGFDRGSVEGFRDYFRQLTEFEPKRAGWYGIQHCSWLCINAKEAENVCLSREVIAMIPEFLDRPGVLGIGEIGLNKNTKNEATVFLEHLDLAAKTDELILIHTPHLEDKYQGTRMILDMLCGRPPHRTTAGAGRPRRGAHDPRRARRRLLGRHDALPDHQVHARAGGRHGRDVRPRADHGQLGRRLGPFEPTAVPDFILEMRRRGHAESLIRRVVYDNPLKFFSQSRNFEFTPPEVYQAEPLA